jgi:hypothetical protein
MNKKILAAALALTMSACICCGCSESKKATEDTKETVGERSTNLDDIVTDEETTSDETTSEEEEASDEEDLPADPQAVQDMGLHELMCNVRFAAPDDKNGFIFEVAVSDNEAESGINIGLFNDKGEKVADMVDDGSQKPDKVAGDNVFSCYYKPESDEAATYELTAKIGAFETDPVRVRVYDDFDSKDFERLEEITADFNAIDGKYRGEDGKIPEDKKEAALEEAEALTKKLYDDGEVIEYSVDKKNGIINIWLDSYLPYVYNLENISE